LGRTSFKGAGLEQALFARADATSANLAGARLYQANFTEANCTRAVFVGADLTYAEMTRADLSGADLSGATLLLARLQNVVEEGTVWGNRAVAQPEDDVETRAYDWKPQG
jgi:uncharacterized protein YjbI with pentapeptide repeats